jgi:hypothetical protein
MNRHFFVLFVILAFVLDICYARHTRRPMRGIRRSRLNTVAVAIPQKQNVLEESTMKGRQKQNALEESNIKSRQKQNVMPGNDVKNSGEMMHQKQNALEESNNVMSGNDVKNSGEIMHQMHQKQNALDVKYSGELMHQKQNALATAHANIKRM